MAFTETWLSETDPDSALEISGFGAPLRLDWDSERVPKLWKQSTIVPLAKCSAPKTLNDFRPVALTSLIMKSFEKIIKEAILLQVEDKLDPLQFAYRAKTHCRSSHQDRHILKFADDSVIVSLLSEDEQDHGPVLSDFVEWCDGSFLHLNVSKTKDMVIDFRRAPPLPTITVIKDTDIELVDQYKYLGVIVDKKLCFEPWVDAVHNLHGDQCSRMKAEL
ncbi:hypothetical protein WMY93_002437 [Mugilogobius chulae]|uniref:Reverse transcriptase domain-containing protein n=1 Tax=Mugilogobius chulae TaxID=88201 RepID=A0AAW0Q8Q0_9GOBI